jgi:hypothetical protein
MGISGLAAMDLENGGSFEVITHPAEFGGIGAWRDFIFG